MWELGCKESWALKNWYFWTVVLEKTLESPLDSKEIQPVHPKGDQSWVFIGRTDAEAELQYFGHLMWRTDSFEKTMMLGASLIAQSVKNLPAIQETWVWFLGREDPLEKGMATHSSILAWRILWTEDAGGLQFTGLQRVEYDWSDFARTHTS